MEFSKMNEELFAIELRDKARQYFKDLKQSNQDPALTKIINQASLAFETIKDEEDFVECYSQFEQFCSSNTSVSAQVNKWFELVNHFYTCEKTWDLVLRTEKQKDYFRNLMELVNGDRSVDRRNVHPLKDQVFSWTNHCNIWDVKVVIVGQDPYPDYSHGLAFSSQAGKPLPYSLRNIYKELNNEGFQTPSHGNLIGWAKQGVLLFNSILTRCTIGKNDDNAHKDIGWQTFTSAVIEWISNNLDGVVFLLWGVEAQKKSDIIMESKARHHILTATLPDRRCARREYPNCHHHSTEIDKFEYKLLQEHPPKNPPEDSPKRCQGFFGCKHFLKTNKILEEQGNQPIDWSDLPNESENLEPSSDLPDESENLEPSSDLPNESENLEPSSDLPDESENLEPSSDLPNESENLEPSSDLPDESENLEPSSDLPNESENLEP